MPSSESAAFRDRFHGPTDPRVGRTRERPLINILSIAVCGALAGANSFAAIEEFGLDRRTGCARYLDPTNGIPSDDTFARVLARLDPAAFEERLSSRIRAVQEITANRLIAIDGETLRRPYDRRDGKAAIPMVPARASENKPSLGQVVVDEKSDEIAAIRELLRLLDIPEAPVTIDAMGCQREIAELIREGGGDHVSAVEQNRPTLYEQVNRAIDEASEGEDPDERRAAEKGHGRQEARTYAILPAPEAVDPEGVWRGLGAAGMAITESGDSQGRCRSEVRHYILGALPSAREFAEVVRGHWGIENDLRRRLDVSFRGDECRVRRDHAPANPGVIRRFASGLLKRETARRRGIETKRLKRAARDDYRERVLFNTEDKMR